MSGSSSSSVLDILCSACEKLMDVGLRKPMILKGCSHCVCAECVQDLRKKKEHKCPICNASFTKSSANVKLTKKVESFWTDSIHISVRRGKNEQPVQYEVTRSMKVKALAELISESGKKSDKKGSKHPGKEENAAEFLTLKINGVIADNEDMLGLYHIEEGDIIKVKGSASNLWQRMVSIELHCAAFVAGLVATYTFFKLLE
jgi:hypothetical protein